jgi:hypothetical protein
MATRQRSKSRLIGLWLYALRKLSRRHNSAVPAYLAFSIGPEMLAIGVQRLDARSDDVALEKAAPLLHGGLKRIEVWCGSRKVGDIPPRQDASDSGAVRDSD